MLKGDKELYMEHKSDTEYKIEETHKWTTRNIDEVIAMKNGIIEFAKRREYDYLFFVDSDLLLHPLTLEGLLLADKKVISAMFWTEWNKGQRDIGPNCWDFDHYSFIDKNRLIEKKIHQVGGTGACILIAREVYEKINYNYIGNISFWGEDRHFSIKVMSYGYKLYCSNVYPVEHIYREDLYTKCIKEWEKWNEDRNKHQLL